MGILQEGVLLLQAVLLVVSSAHCGVEIALGREDTLDLEVLGAAGRTDRNPGATDSSTQRSAIAEGEDTMAELVEFHR